MKISPYIAFNGNCAEAIAFYEKAFKVKAEVNLYKDAPPESGHQILEGTGNYIMHAQFALKGELIMLCDYPPDQTVKIGENITIMAEFDSINEATMAFDALKEGGEIHMEPQETFWSKYFCSLTDKFGISWNISIGCP